jgi:uncharacterized protein
MVASIASSAEPAWAGTAPKPVTERIDVLDFIRGTALFGILLMNITGFGLARAYSNPLNNGGATGADLWAWIIIQMGFEGTQRALFSVLFGAGIILLTTRLEASNPAGAADIYVRRNLLLIGLGLFNAWILLWDGDILYFYGITALFVYGFRKLSARLLLGIGIAAFSLSAVWSLTETRSELAAYQDAHAAQQVAAKGGTLSEEQQAAITGWREKVEEHHLSRERIDESIAVRRFSWSGTLSVIAPDIIWMESYYLYRYFGDIFGMMLIGMALYKLGVVTLQRSSRLYWLMLLGGYGIGLIVNYLEVRWILQDNFSLLAFKQTEASYDIGRLAMMTGHLGALLLFFRSGALPRFRRAVAAVGQMALTNYLTHSLVCLILFTGLGLFGQLARHQLYYVWFAICAVQLVLSPLWLRHYRFGPVEWLWRSLTYMRRQPFRRVVLA